MLRNMVTSLIKHERIKTTVPKAKELRRVADWMVTLGKRGDLHARRESLKVIRTQVGVFYTEEGFVYSRKMVKAWNRRK